MREAQLKKAQKVLDKITEVEGNTWLLPSASNEEKMHTVIKYPNKTYECDCLGFQFSEHCYHIIAVKLYKNEEIVQ